MLESAPYDAAIWRHELNAYAYWSNFNTWSRFMYGFFAVLGRIAIDWRKVAITVEKAWKSFQDR